MSAPRPARLPNASRGLSSVEVKRDGLTAKTARGRRTQAMLVESARIIFERHGFLRARIFDICAEAGVSHGSFYTYFASKEAIFAEVVELVEMDLLSFDQSPPDALPVERIRLANQHYLKTYRKHAKMMKVILEVSTFEPKVLTRRIRREAFLAAAIEKRTREYQEAGIAAREIDARYAAYALGGMVQYFAEQMFIQGLDADLDKACEELTRLWARALGLNSEAPSGRDLTHDRAKTAGSVRH